MENKIMKSNFNQVGAPKKSQNPVPKQATDEKTDQFKGLQLLKDPPGFPQVVSTNPGAQKDNDLPNNPFIPPSSSSNSSTRFNQFGISISSEQAVIDPIKPFMEMAPSILVQNLFKPPEKPLFFGIDIGNESLNPKFAQHSTLISTDKASGGASNGGINENTSENQFFRNENKGSRSEILAKNISKSGGFIGRALVQASSQEKVENKTGNPFFTKDNKGSHSEMLAKNISSSGGFIGRALAQTSSQEKNEIKLENETSKLANEEIKKNDSDKTSAVSALKDTRKDQGFIFTPNPRKAKVATVSSTTTVSNPIITPLETKSDPISNPFSSKKENSSPESVNAISDINKPTDKIDAKVPVSDRQILLGARIDSEESKLFLPLPKPNEISKDKSKIANQPPLEITKSSEVKNTESNPFVPQILNKTSNEIHPIIEPDNKVKISERIELEETRIKTQKCVPPGQSLSNSLNLQNKSLANPKEREAPAINQKENNKEESKKELANILPASAIQKDPIQNSNILSNLLASDSEPRTSELIKSSTSLPSESEKTDLHISPSPLIITPPKSDRAKLGLLLPSPNEENGIKPSPVPLVNAPVSLIEDPKQSSLAKIASTLSSTPHSDPNTSSGPVLLTTEQILGIFKSDAQSKSNFLLPANTKPKNSTPAPSNIIRPGSVTPNISEPFKFGSALSASNQPDPPKSLSQFASKDAATKASSYMFGGPSFDASVFSKSTKVPDASSVSTQKTGLNKDLDCRFDSIQQGKPSKAPYFVFGSVREDGPNKAPNSQSKPNEDATFLLGPSQQGEQNKATFGMFGYPKQTNPNNDSNIFGAPLKTDTNDNTPNLVNKPQSINLEKKLIGSGALFGANNLSNTRSNLLGTTQKTDGSKRFTGTSEFSQKIDPTTIASPLFDIPRPLLGESKAIDPAYPTKLFEKSPTATSGSLFQSSGALFGGFLFNGPDHSNPFLRGTSATLQSFPSIAPEENNSKSSDFLQKKDQNTPKPEMLIPSSIAKLEMSRKSDFNSSNPNPLFASINKSVPGSSLSLPAPTYNAPIGQVVLTERNIKLFLTSQQCTNKEIQQEIDHHNTFLIKLENLLEENIENNTSIVKKFQKIEDEIVRKHNLLSTKKCLLENKESLKNGLLQDLGNLKMQNQLLSKIFADLKEKEIQICPLYNPTSERKINYQSLPKYLGEKFNFLQQKLESQRKGQERQKQSLEEKFQNRNFHYLQKIESCRRGTSINEKQLQLQLKQNAFQRLRFSFSSSVLQDPISSPCLLPSQIPPRIIHSTKNPALFQQIDAIFFLLGIILSIILIKIVN